MRVRLARRDRRDRFGVYARRLVHRVQMPTLITGGRDAGVPVWNGLTTEWHPTQMLADVLTMTEHTTKHLRDIRFCYLGDARNNPARSLLGMDVRIAAPAHPPAPTRDPDGRRPRSRQPRP